MEIFREPLPDLPERLFVVGEESKGESVTAYHKPERIKSIMDALEPDEAQVIRNSLFRKFVAIADKPSFSGRVVRFIITRQLQVANKHEIWLLFTGKPIRFSLREFAIVTGLPCGEFPKTSKRRRTKAILESSYWPTMFGKLDTVIVDSVVDIFNRQIVTDKEMRIKYACLALVDGVLMPTTHTPKLVKEHAELISDIEEFFAYPWGRLAFEMTIGSIKDRDATALSQKSLALKGFVQALQLVMVEVVPSLTEAVQLEPPSSESESEGAKEVEVTSNSPKISLSPGHARGLHDAGQVEVNSIIPEDEDIEIDEAALRYPGDGSDQKVEIVLRLINEDFDFSNDFFHGD